VVVPLVLVEQWIEELQRFSPVFDIQVYHNKSSTQKSAAADVQRRNEIFTQKHELFNGDRANARVVVISTYGTIASRHGPSALRKWRERTYRATFEAKGSVHQPVDWFEVPDRKWPRDLSGRWHSILLDEAHHVRNNDSLAHIAIKFMDCPFTVLCSATPLFTGIRDNFGLAALIEPRPVLNFPIRTPDGATFKKNDDPFEVADDHPAAVLRLTSASFAAFVLSLEDSVEQGRRLEQIWSQYLICRRYTSSCPIGSTQNVIGQALPRCESIVLDLNNPPTAQAVYDTFAEAFLKKLMATDTTRTGDSRVVVNANSYRALVLMSTWPMLALSHSAMNPPKKNKKGWSKNGHVIRILLNQIAKSPELPAAMQPYDVPPATNILPLIGAVLQHSSRLSALVANIADQVVKRKEKAIVWSLYPLEQLIIREILVSFGIDARVLASDLTQGQKSDLVKNFNSPDICQVLIASYTANGAGLNLQQSCHNVHLFDPAPSANAQEQAIGRTYRLGQPRKVTVIEYYVRRTFNEKVVNTQILRALPGLMAMIDKDQVSKTYAHDYTTPGLENVFDSTSLKGFVLDGEGKLWHSLNPDIPRELLGKPPLEPEEVLIQFFTTQRGRRAVQHGGFGEAFQENLYPTVESDPEVQSEMEDDEDGRPKPTPRASRRKRKATPSEVEDDGDVGSDAGAAPATVTRKTRSRAAGKKPVEAAGPRVRAKKAPVIKAKTSKPKTTRAKQQNTGSATSPTTVASSSKTPRKRAKVDPNVGRMTAPDDEYA
jgi:hypothetical protein